MKAPLLICGFPRRLVGFLGYIVFASRVLNADVMFYDSFECATGLLTSYQYYDYASFPEGGTSLPNNPSKSWEMGTGRAMSSDGWLYFGTPLEHGDPEFVRFNSRRFDFGDVEFSFKYRSGPFGGADGYPVNSWEAADLWVRYQTQYDLYVVQVDRTDNKVVAKRKVPAEGWGGPSNLLSNRGVYYELITDSESPTGAGTRSVAWSGVGLPNLAHDRNTVYEFKVRVVTLAGGKVQMKLWRGGVLVASWTDANDGVSGGTNGGTLSQHLALGYYNDMLEWQEEWGHPITRPGATGFRADNITIWIDDFRVSTLQTNDSKVNITREGDKVVLDWIGMMLQSSDDLRTWNDEACAVSPLTITPVGSKFFRVRNQ